MSLKRAHIAALYAQNDRPHPLARTRAICDFHASPAIRDDYGDWSASNETVQVAIDLFQVESIEKLIHSWSILVFICFKSGTTKHLYLDENDFERLCHAWMDPRPNNQGVVNLHTYPL